MPQCEHTHMDTHTHTHTRRLRSDSIYQQPIADSPCPTQIIEAQFSFPRRSLIVKISELACSLQEALCKPCCRSPFVKRTEWIHTLSAHRHNTAQLFSPKLMFFFSSKSEFLLQLNPTRGQGFIHCRNC